MINALDNCDGIEIQVDGKIIAIDLDHCFEDKKLYSWSEEIFSHFPNTYIEISLSGAGLRIILLAIDNYSYVKYKYYIKKNNVEVYVAGVTNRFVTIKDKTIQKLMLQKTGWLSMVT